MSNKYLLWGTGFLFGLFWMGLNFNLTIKLFTGTLLNKYKSKIVIYFLIKFPLLYGLLLLILLLNKLPIASILTGMTTFFVFKYARTRNRSA